MHKSTKFELAALVAALSLCTHGVAQAAQPNQDSANGTQNSNPFGVTEHSSPARLGTDSGCGEGMCGTNDKSGTSKAGKGHESSCKGKEGSCKGKDGSCKGKDSKGNATDKASDKKK